MSGERAAWALFLFGAVACLGSRQPRPPHLDAIEPNAGPTTSAVPLVLSGGGFLPRVEAVLGGQVRLDGTFRAELRALSGDLPPLTLDSLTRVSDTTFSAVVPMGAPPGLYTIDVVDPYGRLATADATLTYEVCPDVDLDGSCADIYCPEGPGGPPVLEGPAGAPSCADGLDNDCDLAVDLADDDCLFNGTYVAAVDLPVPATVVSASCTAPLVDFPYLIRHPGALELRSLSQGGQMVSELGWDLAFFDATGTSRLPHDLAAYEPTTGAFTAWVLVPNIVPGEDATLALRWGDASVSAPSEEPLEVWGPEYAAVWSMEPGLVDSAASAHTTTVSGALDSDAHIGRGLTFDGVDDVAQTSSSELAVAATFTISFWLRIDDTSVARHILWQGVGTANGWGEALPGPPLTPEMHLSIGDILPAGFGVTTGYVSFFLGDTDGGGNGTADVLSARAPLTDTTTWHHIAAVVANLDSAPTVDFYVDGTWVMSDDATLARTTRTAWDTPLRFGQPGQSVRFFAGGLDEVRLTTVARDACWIGTEFNNQR